MLRVKLGVYCKRIVGKVKMNVVLVKSRQVRFKYKAVALIGYIRLKLGNISAAEKRAERFTEQLPLKIFHFTERLYKMPL